MADVKIDLDILHYPVPDVIEIERVTHKNFMGELAHAQADGNALPADFLLAMAYVSYRREHPDFTWEEAQNAWTFGELLDSIEVEDELPLANRAQRRGSAKRRPTSASSTAGDRATSTT